MSSGNEAQGSAEEGRSESREGPEIGDADGATVLPSPTLAAGYPPSDPSPAVSSAARPGSGQRGERQKRSRTTSTGTTTAGRGDRITRRLASLATAAEYADVSTRTLRRYISHGRLTGYRVGPRLVKVDLNELDQLARPIPTARSPGS